MPGPDDLLGNSWLRNPAPLSVHRGKTGPARPCVEIRCTGFPIRQYAQISTPNRVAHCNRISRVNRRSSSEKNICARKFPRIQRGHWCTCPFNLAGYVVSPQRVRLSNAWSYRVRMTPGLMVPFTGFQSSMGLLGELMFGPLPYSW